jgi:hypothetical protein
MQKAGMNIRRSLQTTVGLLNISSAPKVPPIPKTTEIGCNAILPFHPTNVIVLNSPPNNDPPEGHQNLTEVYDWGIGMVELGPGITYTDKHFLSLVQIL